MKAKSLTARCRRRSNNVDRNRIACSSTTSDDTLSSLLSNSHPWSLNTVSSGTIVPKFLIEDEGVKIYEKKWASRPKTKESGPISFSLFRCVFGTTTSLLHLLSIPNALEGQISLQNGSLYHLQISDFFCCSVVSV